MKISKINSILLMITCLFFSSCNDIDQSQNIDKEDATIENKSATQEQIIIEGEAPIANQKIRLPNDQGKLISLSVGDILEIQIPTIPTEGLNWETENVDTTILKQIGEANYIAGQDPSDAGGIVILQFEVIGKGKTSLTLIYVNSPDDNTPTLFSKSYGLTVEAK